MVEWVLQEGTDLMLPYKDLYFPVFRDGLQESAIVAKTFVVEDPVTTTTEDSTSDDYDATYSSFFESSDTDSTLKSSKLKKKVSRHSQNLRLI